MLIYILYNNLQLQADFTNNYTKTFLNNNRFCKATF